MTEVLSTCSIHLCVQKGTGQGGQGGLGAQGGQGGQGAPGSSDSGAKCDSLHSTFVSRLSQDVV